MKIREVSGKEITVKETTFNQLLDQIDQMERGLLYALDAVRGAKKRGKELKGDKENYLEAN